MKKLIGLIVLLVIGFYVGWPAFSGWQLHTALERKDAATVGRKIDFPAVRKSLEPVVTREVSSGMDRYLGDLGPIANVFGPVLKSQYGPRVVEATLNTLITPENIVRLYAEKDDARSAAERIVMEELNKPGGLFAGLFGGMKSGSDGGPSLTDRMKLPGGLGGFGESLQGQIGGALGAGSGQMPDIKTVITSMIEKARAQRGAKSMTEAPASKPSVGGGFGVSNIKKFGFNGPLAMEVGVAASGASAKPDVLAEMAFTGADWKVTRLVPGF
jgi:hypothetical protein